MWEWGYVKGFVCVSKKARRRVWVGRCLVRPAATARIGRSYEKRKEKEKKKEKEKENKEASNTTTKQTEAPSRVPPLACACSYIDLAAWAAS